MRSLKKLVFAMVLLMGVKAQAQTVDAGLKAWSNENYNTALDIFKKATEADPNNATAWFYYGQALFKSGDVVGAKAAFDRGVAARPAEFLCIIGQAKGLLDGGDVAGAEKKIAGALKGTKSKDPDIYRFAADAYATNKNKDWAKAIEYAQNGLITVKGKLDFNSYDALGDVYFEKHYSGNGEDRDIGFAITNYEKSYALNPKSPYAMTKIGKIWSTTKTDLSYRSCIDALDKAKAADATFVPMRSVYSFIFEKTGQLEKAKAELELYIAGCEDKVKANDRMINILYQLKDWNGTLELAKQMNGMYPKNCDYLQVLAHANTELGNYLEALKYFDLMQNQCAAQKLGAEDYSYLAKANKAAGNDSIAILYYYQVIALDSTKEQAILKEIANGYYSSKKYDLAIVMLEKLNEKYPTPNTKYKLMDAYYKSKKWRETIMAADSFIVGNEGNPLGYLYKARALYYVDTADERKALADMYHIYLEKTKDTTYSKQVLISEKSEAHQSICVHYIKKKNLKAAMAELDEALIDDPKNQALLSLHAKIEKALKPLPVPNAPIKSK